MSRPLLKYNEIRQRIDCYFSNEELNTIRSRAKEAGLPLSTFIRKSSLRSHVHVMPTANAEIWQSLSHTAANLNQIAKLLNSGLAYGVDIDIITDLYEQVRLLRLQLAGVAI